mgnify:CR=1 FL=1
MANRIAKIDELIMICQPASLQVAAGGNLDDETRDKIAMLPMCRYDRAFKADDMNHDVFKIYV